LKEIEYHLKDFSVSQKSNQSLDISKTHDSHLFCDFQA